MGKYRIFILLAAMVLMLPLSEAIKSKCNLSEQRVEKSVSDGIVDKVVPEGGSGSDFSAAPSQRTSVPRFFSGSAYLYVCGVVLLAFLLMFVFASISGRIMMVPALVHGLVLFAVFWLMLGIGLLAVKLASGILGLAVYIGAPALIAVVYLTIFFILKRRSVTMIAANSVRRSASSAGAVKFDMKVLYGAMAAVLVISAIALIAGEPSYYLTVPFACACAGVLLWRLLKLRLFLLLGFLAIELFVLIYCIPVIQAGENVTFWRVLALSLLYLSLLAPIGDLYCHRDVIL